MWSNLLKEGALKWSESGREIVNSVLNKSRLRGRKPSPWSLSLHFCFRSSEGVPQPRTGFGKYYHRDVNPAMKVKEVVWVEWEEGCRLNSENINIQWWGKKGAAEQPEQHGLKRQHASKRMWGHRNTLLTVLPRSQPIKYLKAAVELTSMDSITDGIVLMKSEGEDVG